jgi:hypothetical protein
MSGGRARDFSPALPPLPPPNPHKRIFFSFPSSCLGTEILAQALLGLRSCPKSDNFYLVILARRSLAQKWVPKREPGNQKKKLRISGNSQ